MSAQSAADEPKLHYYSNPRPRLSSGSHTSGVTSTLTADQSPSHFPSHRELLPILVSQQSSIYKDRLLQYNKLVSAGRGGGGKSFTPPLPTVTLASPNAKPTTRSRSSSKVSSKGTVHTKLGSQNGHGNKTSQSTDIADRALLIPKKETQPKMSGSRHSDQSAGHSALPIRPRPAPSAQQTSPPPPAHSSSVPSTPHQYPRRFPDDEDREPSPGATQKSSSSSVCSETNGNAPTLRRLPPAGYCRFETDVPRPRRRMDYRLGSDRLEKVDSSRIPSRLSEKDEEKLAKDIEELYKQLLPTEEVERKRKKLVQKLERLFNDEWPGHEIKVHLFGSSGNLLCSDDSDVDICIKTEWKELENVCLIADLLSRQGMEKVICVKAAKIPIVKIWDPELKLACDMNVNNTAALDNTRMVRTYVQIDERVRPLAMVIKYWTRRRVVNVPAFGGTLSSYTWICMIIGFLQLREPPVLPALHQRDESERLTKGGVFADDLDKLKGFGDSNNESLAALLFHFFRFYAYEFDFEKDVLSIRLGKTMTKVEKGWQFGGNNALCVEEPFNKNRNLGNTADDISFRGLHLELRRAFDLLSAGNFEECCEEYIFPKEEIQQPPKPPVSRPIAVVPIRSSSQQHGNRGGRGGLRGVGGGGRQFRNGNSSRRASSSVVHDPNAGYPQTMPVTINAVSPEILWYQPQSSQLGVQGSQLGVAHPDLFATSLNALAAQETNLRFQLYTQAQQLNQQQVLAHAQRMQGSSTQSTDRPRGNSFDNPPLTAPIRPDLVYGYPFPMQHTPYFHPGLTTYPTSPATSSTPSNGTSDFRRSLHRNSVANDAASAGGGPLRSQSQPASRSSLNASQLSAYPGIAQSPSSMPIQSRQINPMTVPNFVPDETTEADFDDAPIKPLSDSPTEDDGPRYIGYIVPDSSSPIRKLQGFSGTVPTLGEASQNGQGRRRLSTDQSPQSILDRRMKRTSRSPSPLGHARAFSVGTNSAPLTSAPFQQANGKLTPNRAPLVVNGSVAKPIPAPSVPRQPSITENLTSEDPNFDNPLHINQGVNANDRQGEQASSVYQPSATVPSPLPDRPVIVDGSSTSRAPLPPQGMSDGSFHQHMAIAGALPNNFQYAPVAVGVNGPPLYSAPAVARVNGHLASLDLATDARNFIVPPDFHLSPVYEHRTPSPTVVRRFDGPNGSSQKTPPTRSPPAGPAGPSGRHDSGNGSPVADSRANGPQRETGQLRGPKGPSDNNTWHRPKSRKRGVADLKQAASGSPPGEQFPKSESERKGG